MYALLCDPIFFYSIAFVTIIIVKRLITSFVSKIFVIITDRKVCTDSPPSQYQSDQHAIDYLDTSHFENQTPIVSSQITNMTQKLHKER